MNPNQNITITALGTRQSLWGEGPIWWKNALYYVDIEGKAIVRLDPKSGDEHVWQLDQRIGCIAPCSDGHLLYAGDRGIARFNLETKVSVALCDPETNRPDNRFNDGKCDPSGRFWAGTINTKKVTGTAALYCLESDQKITLKLSGLTNSNGLAWSSDGSRFFHVDTPRRSIRSYAYSADCAQIDVGKELVDTDALGFDSSPDGMCIDRQNRLWVAFCHGGCVACFDSVDGTLLRTIELPVVETTACTFGGPQMNQLFVTTGIKKDLAETNAGKIFVIDGLNTSARPPHCFK